MNHLSSGFFYKVTRREKVQYTGSLFVLIKAKQGVHIQQIHLMNTGLTTLYDLTRPTSIKSDFFIANPFLISGS